MVVSRPSIGFIGAGRVARSLALALAEAGYRITAVASRASESAHWLAASLPETVVVTPIPDDPKYAYAIVNDQRVIVEPSSRTVIQVIK